MLYMVNFARNIPWNANSQSLMMILRALDVHDVLYVSNGRTMMRMMKKKKWTMHLFWHHSWLRAPRVLHEHYCF